MSTNSNNHVNTARFASKATRLRSKATTKPSTIQVTFRIPADWIERADTLALKLSRPGLEATRTDAFRALGKFPLGGPHSDSLFWLRACATASCVLVPADLFWYRIHGGQHLRSERGQYDALPLFRVYWEALDGPECPLTAEEREQAKRNRMFLLVRKAYQDLRGGRVRLAFERVRQAGLSVADVARYLRRPQRHPFAGTPLGADGQFVMPSPMRAGHEAPSASAVSDRAGSSRHA